MVDYLTDFDCLERCSGFVASEENVATPIELIKLKNRILIT